MKKLSSYFKSVRFEYRILLIGLIVVLAMGMLLVLFSDQIELSKSRADNLLSTYLLSVINPSPVPITTELVNPMRGLYKWNNKEIVTLPELSHEVYKRAPGYDWYDLEKTSATGGPGGYNFTQIDSDIAAAASQGRRFAFRVRTMHDYNDGGTTVTRYVPNYLKTYGWEADAANDNGVRDGIKDTFIPDWNNTYFLERLQALFTALSAKYNGDPRVAWIDMGVYGQFGEWSISTARIDYSQAPAGITPATDTTKKKIVDIVTNAFKDTQIVMTLSRQATAAVAQAFAAPTKYPVGWRVDCLGRPTYFSQFINDSAFNAATNWQSRWKIAPIITELCYITNNSDFTTAIQQVKDQHISMTGNGNSPEWAALSLTDQNLFKELGRTLGYRIEINSVSLPSTIEVGSTFTITSEWENVGVAPIYETQIVKYLLKDSAGATVWSQNSLIALKGLLPAPDGGPTVVSDTFDTPVLQDGNYTLAVIVNNTINTKPLKLAIAGRQNDGSYTLGTVAVLKPTPIPVPATLTSSLSALPSTGAAPLAVQVRADVAGTAIGTIDYNFWYNCADSTNSTSTSQTACGNITTPPAGTCVETAGVGYRCNDVTQISQTFAHTYPAGSYKAKVIVLRGGLVSMSQADITSRAMGTIIIENAMINNNGGIATSADFTFNINGGTPITAEADGVNDVVVFVDDGPFSILQVSGPTEYVTTYTNCTDLVVPAGGSVTCTITHNDIAPSVSVTLTSQPMSGNEPLNAQITADIGGPATGTIDYNFWYNCSDPTTSTSAAITACGNITAPSAGTCVETPGIGYRCNDVSSLSKVISHAYPAGNYVAKVIALRGGQVAQSQVNISSLATPTPTPIPRPTGTIVIVNTLVNDNGGQASLTDLSFNINNGTPITVDADGQNEVSVVLADGPFTIRQISTPADYVVGYNNCVGISTYDGGSVYCYITTNDIYYPTPTPTPVPPAADITAPTIDIITGIGLYAPRRSTLKLTGVASDNVAVTKVEFYSDGVLACADAVSPYTCSVVLPGAKNKAVQFQARAYDAAGNVGYSETLTITTY